MSGPRTAADPVGSVRGLLAGATVLAVAQGVANGGNYLVNLLLGRWLTPGQFADASLLVAIMLLTSVVALGLQLVTARAVALEPDTSAVRSLNRFAVLVGVVVAVVLAAGAPTWQQLLRTESPWPLVILAAGLPWYLVQSVGRGELQGRTDFGRLALSYVVEMVVRTALTVALVVAGFGVEGAAVGLAVSFVATWASVRVSLPGGGRTECASSGDLRRYGLQVSVLLAGQIVANNADVLIAKHFLAPSEAARYAAVSLVGRAVFFLTWSVAVALFPIAARGSAQPDPSDHLLRRAAAVVLALGAACTVAAAAVGGPVLSTVLGPHYDGLAWPLAGYALATTALSLANLVASHRLATGRLLLSWLVLVGACVQTTALLFLHADITTLVVTQIACMVALAGVVWGARNRALAPTRLRIPLPRREPS